MDYGRPTISTIYIVRFYSYFAPRWGGTDKKCGLGRRTVEHPHGVQSWRGTQFFALCQHLFFSGQAFPSPPPIALLGMADQCRPGALHALHTENRAILKKVGKPLLHAQCLDMAPASRTILEHGRSFTQQAWILPLLSALCLEMAVVPRSMVGRGCYFTHHALT
ncbi:hypothetical protein IQ07DRAFT_80172 [Pyrenochaeta sp. DS3sAY3a]|nr:hypothetical protein IQ07DRAFT_80172 [Pyrenochaeta sp. DS3sAY3a]